MSKKQPAMSGEERLIARYFAPLAKHPGALGLTDDAAVLKVPAGSELVLTADAIVGGIHFFADDPADKVARKALRVNLSDLAAKGAKPAGFLLTLALPKEVGDGWLKAFARGLGADARLYGCPLLGGDTVRTTGPVAVSITAVGTLPQGTTVRRRGAKVGDRIVVTGTIGDGALGLAVRNDAAMAESCHLSPLQRAHLIDRYLLPRPRNRLAEAIRRHASAAMDISDGLAGDLAKLCSVSRVAAEIDAGSVPLSASAKAALTAEPSLLDAVLTGGDDYEIVCTLPPRRLRSFTTAAKAAGVAVTEIGHIVAGRGAVRFLDPDGSPLALAQLSYSHF